MKNEIMIITGTRKGIGKYLAHYYLKRGHTVIGCSRGESTIDDERYHHYRLDVADEKRVIEMVRGVRKEFGRIDVLLNNAGVASMNHFVITPYKTVKEMMETNYYGTFLFSREVSKVMLKKKYGRIVNFVSIAAPLQVEGEAAYAASKAAVENLTKVMAREVAEYGITVNALGATPIWTDMIRNVPKDKVDALLERQAINRLGEMRDVSQLCDFLIDEKSDFITGQVIYLGGVS
ncbi:SDR family NAD(P)-dependent oxidoreductase [Hydrogenimonas sp.]